MVQLPLDGSKAVTRLVGIFDADGSLRGELSYWVGARLGRRHCSLCERTHRSVRERKDWRACRDELPIPFDTVHRDETSPEVMKATNGKFPAVVAVTSAGAFLLLGPDELEQCARSPVALLNAVRESCDRANLKL